MSLFEELKRRKVVRTAVAYLVAAFVAAQVTQLLVDGLDLPAWILKAVLITEIVALPLVVGLAWAFDLTPQGVELTGSDATTSKVAVPWTRIALPVTASILVLLIVFAFMTLNSEKTPALNQNLVAVMPFHVSGDPQLAYLSEGMIDLLAAKLTGEGGSRAADPRAVMNSVKQHSTDVSALADSTAAEVARSVGSGRALVGSIVGTPGSFTISARLLQAPAGREILRAEQAGSVDSLLVTVDKLVAKLLSLQAGEGSQRLSSLTTTSLPALRSYLDGRVAYRHGEFGKASDLFANAMETDTTFILSAIGHWMTRAWGEGRPTDLNKLFRLIAQNRDRVQGVDLLIANAIVGKDWPKQRSQKQRILDWEAVVNAAPDRPDAWFWYGDLMFHFGPVASFTNSFAQSDAAFSRVLQLDSTYMPALLHKMDIAMTLDSPQVLRRLDAIRRARDPQGAAGMYQGARRVRIIGDSAMLQLERKALDTMSLPRLARIARVGGTAPGAVDDGVHAAELMLARPSTPGERLDATFEAMGAYLEYGMPSRARPLYDDLMHMDVNQVVELSFHLMDVLFWNADTTGAGTAAQEVERLLAKGGEKLEITVRARCALEIWRVSHDDMTSYNQNTLQLSRVPVDSTQPRSTAEVCMQTLATMKAMAHEPASLQARVQTLDAILRDAPPQHASYRNISNIVLARAAEQAGDRALAYRAISRMGIGNNTDAYYSTMLRERARLAALNGDRATAIRLYRKYLLLHERAEPALKAEDDAVRRDLARLTGEH